MRRPEQTKSGLSLGLWPANDRRRYFVMTTLIGCNNDSLAGGKPRISPENCRQFCSHYFQLHFVERRVWHFGYNIPMFSITSVFVKYCYTTRSWNIVNWSLRNILPWNFDRNSYIFIQEKKYCYTTRSWNIINWALRNKLKWNCDRNSYIFIQENALENVVKMAAILSQTQCVNKEQLVNLKKPLMIQFRDITICIETIMLQLSNFEISSYLCQINIP